MRNVEGSGGGLLVRGSDVILTKVHFVATRATAVLGVALLLAARSPSVDATAKVLDATGRELGVLTFADAGAAISVTGTLRGLTPGVHGVHLHTVGRCDGPDFASAGAHGLSCGAHAEICVLNGAVS